MYCGSTPAWPPTGAVPDTSAPSPMPADGPPTAADHTQVGGELYVMAIYPPIGTTTVAPVAVATVVPLTATTGTVPPVIATWTAKPAVFTTGPVGPAGIRGVATAPAAGPLTTSDQVASQVMVTVDVRV